MKKFIVGVVGLASAFAASWTGLAETPDFLADTLTGDGVGYVDLGYKYKGVTSPKTSKVTIGLHIEKRGMGERQISEANISRSLFGFLDANGRCMSYCRFYGTGTSASDVLQIWGGDYKNAKTGTLNEVQDLNLSIDYAQGKVAWDGVTFTENLEVSQTDSPLSYWVFAHNAGSSKAGTPFDLKGVKIYEKPDGGSEALAHDYKPCFYSGRAALYDEKTGDILYPTSEGFTLSGYDISVGSGKTLIVNALSCAPRTLSLAAGSALEFDGNYTLSSAAEVVLPDDGVVKVTLSKNNGKGKYVLIDNLPSDFSIERFAVKPIPGHQALLSKSGTELVLTLKAQGAFPDALADKLTGDGVGHVDTEYCYNRAAFPKTTRMTAHFYSADRGRAGRSGDITRAFFGFLDGTAKCISYFRFSGGADITYDNAQLWGHDGIGDSYASKVVAAKNIPGNMAGDMYFNLDYENGKAAFGLEDAEPFDFPSSANTTTKSYWIFTANGNNNPTPLDLIRMSIYETDGAEAFLAHDYVPAVDGGRAVVYDKVVQKVLEPTSDGFSASGLSYRLSVNGEVAYAVGTVSVDCSEPEDVAGWVVLSDADDRIVESGTGTTATFDMPESPVRVVWTKDAVVASGERLVVDATACYNDLVLEAGATLVFLEGGKIIVSGDMAVPSVGSANVEFAGRGLPGEYVFATGVQSDLRLSAFRVVALPMGLSGTVRRDGDSLILALRDDSAGSGGLVAKTLKGDGVGYIDTKYFYDYPKTSKVTFDFSTDDRGMSGRSVGTSTTRAVFGFLNDSGAANGQLSYVRFTGNGTDSSDVFQMWGGNGTYSSKSINARDVSGRLLGDLSLLFDYANGMASYEGGQNPFALNTPVMTSPKSYWIFNVNGQNYPTAFEFKRMCVFETEAGKESLAHDYVPALKDGKAGVCDLLDGSMLYPTTDGFSLDFGVVSQSFYSVSTVSKGMPVAVPAFGVERMFTFVRDGSVTAKFGMSSLTLSRYDASGTLLSTDQKTDVEASDVFPVALDGAAKLVVTVTGPDYPSEKTVGQSFDPVDFLGVAPATYRRVKKHDYEVALVGAATLTFKTEVSEVWADNYAADGTLIGSEKLSGAFDVGQSLEIPAGTAAWRIVRVAECRPGLMLLLR